MKPVALKMTKWTGCVHIVYKEKQKWQVVKNAGMIHLGKLLALAKTELEDTMNCSKNAKTILVRQNNKLANGGMKKTNAIQDLRRKHD